MALLLSGAEPNTTDYRHLAQEMLKTPTEFHEIVAPNGTKYRWWDGVLQWEYTDDRWIDVNPGWSVEHIGTVGMLGAIVVMLSAIESGVDFTRLSCGNRISTIVDSY